MKMFSNYVKKIKNLQKKILLISDFLNVFNSSLRIADSRWCKCHEEQD
jgi:hypothetical protein